MFGFRNTTSTAMTKKHTVLVTEADSWVGFYCAWGLLKHMNKDAAATNAGDDKFHGVEKVVCAVRSRDTDFAQELEKLGAELREWSGEEDWKNVQALQDKLFKKDVTALTLVPIHDVNAMHHVTEAFVEAAERCEGRVTCMTLWSTIGALHYPHHGGESSSNDKNNERYSQIFRQFVLIEKRVRESKIKHEVILRIGFVQQQLFGFANVIQNRGLLPWTDITNKVAPLNAKDVAYANALVLGDERAMMRLNKQTLILTGPNTHTGKEIVQAANRVLQAKIQLEEVNTDAMAKILRANADADEVEVRMTLAFFELLNRNKLDTATPDLASLIGRKPADIDVFFKENADSFKPRT